MADKRREMALNSNQGDRKAILRDVYEDNLRTTKEKYRISRRSSFLRRHGGGRRVGASAWAIGIVLLMAAALNVPLHDAPAEADALSDNVIRGTFPLERTAQVAVSDVLPSITDIPSVANLYGLHVNTIVIDAGHGGRDPGTTGQTGMQEKEITLDVARRLKRRLEAHSGYKILMTRDADVRMPLRERIEFANRNDADLFISIHVNWLPVDSIAPIETYYYGPDSDSRAVRLAQRENRNSGYSVAEFNDLTQQLGLELKIQESSQAANSIQEGLIESLSRLGNDVSDWGAKSGDFMVLLGVEAPSVLAEIGSLSNGEDEARMSTVSYREELAYILEQGLVNYLESHAHDNHLAEYGSQEDSKGL